jgi:hypothetical protein
VSKYATPCDAPCMLARIMGQMFTWAFLKDLWLMFVDVFRIRAGLRPDYMFKDSQDKGTPLAPFLQYAGTCIGRFGVSHTRPPTESRPGHVALTSGFYEDPSALFSGWQANRVPFDSVFARVTAAWGFGSPDVVPIWHKHGAYQYSAYDASLEDWSTNTNLFELDTWVFNRTAELLEGKAPVKIFTLLGLLSLLSQATFCECEQTLACWCSAVCCRAVPCLNDGDHD